jgi:DNA-binding ferritin-like protein
LAGILTHKSDLCRSRGADFGAYSLNTFARVVEKSSIPQAAKDVNSSQDTLLDLFERIENFFRRLETYTEMPPTTEMMDVTMKIMVEVLCILAIATKEIKQSRTSESLAIHMHLHLLSEFEGNT